MDILIFTTNVEKPEDVSRIKPILTTIATIKDWSFDLEDCDKILRIVANSISPRHIELLLQKAGFNCRELEY
jgi:hypothetical protein